MRLKFYLIPLVVGIISCKEQTETQSKFDPLKTDTIYCQYGFPIDLNTIAFRHFYKHGAVKGFYSHRKDWCGGRSKIFKLYNKTNDELFTFGLEGCCFMATQRVFNGNGIIINEYELICKGAVCTETPEQMYQSDSVLLHTLIPMIEEKAKNKSNRTGC